MFDFGGRLGNGDIFKINISNLSLAEEACHEWIKRKYPGSKKKLSGRKIIRLNGLDVDSLIYTIQKEDNIKYLFFDISAKNKLEWDLTTKTFKDSNGEIGYNSIFLTKKDTRNRVFFFDQSDFYWDCGHRVKKVNLNEKKISGFKLKEWLASIFTIDELKLIENEDESILKRDSLSIYELKTILNLFSGISLSDPKNPKYPKRYNPLFYNLKNKICKKIVELADPVENFDTIIDIHGYYNHIIANAIEKQRKKISSLDFIIKACLDQIEIASKYSIALKTISNENYFRLNRQDMSYSSHSPHLGYDQLSHSYYLQGKYTDSLNVALKAKEEGWIGIWDIRIEEALFNLKNEL